ncbi:Oxysterol-binding protein 8 [Galdieria sulphuraria]|nr:Oxysterol-binding protein 8 [Galdieria sulphuraria]
METSETDSTGNTQTCETRQTRSNSWTAWGIHAISTITDGAKQLYTKALGLDELEEKKLEDEEGVTHVEVDEKTKRDLWNQLSTLVGADVINMRLSLPVWLFEPTTALQRMCETLQFHQLLDMAATCEEPVERDALVAAFTVSAFAHTERVYKPFNPVLGETFEWTSRDGTTRVLCEQVSHHPPVSVSYTEGPGWVAQEVFSCNAYFLGNSVEIRNTGSRYVYLTSFDERYEWTLPVSAAQNLFVGGSFIDHYGELILRSSPRGSVTSLTFTKCGWFGRGRYAVNGDIVDADGYRASGWINLQANVWMQSHFEVPDNAESIIPPTDSRFRPDRRALEGNNLSLANLEKVRVENIQRERENQRQKTGTTYVPAWFYQDDNNEWHFGGKYWKETRNMSEDQKEQMKLW